MPQFLFSLLTLHKLEDNSSLYVLSFSHAVFNHQVEIYRAVGLLQLYGWPAGRETHKE